MTDFIARPLPIGDTTLFTESVGEPGAPVLLLLMGAMASGVWWPEEFCRHLAAHGRRVVRYDHRDTGRSTSHAPGDVRYTTETLAADALAVLDAYTDGDARAGGVARGHLVGMSLGGYLAQLVALMAPARVASLTLIASEPLAPADPSIPPMDPRVAAYHAAAETLDWTDRSAVLEYQVGAWRMQAGSAHSFDAEAIRALAMADWERTPNLLTTFNHAGLREPAGWVGRLDEITAPALVIHGTEDPVLPFGHALALHAALPGSTLLPLPGTGHELHPADWPAIIDAILAHTASADERSDARRSSR